MAKRIRPVGMSVEDWLRAEGIHKEPPRPSKARRQYKSIDGQQSLIELGDDGRPLVIRKKVPRSGRKK